LAQEKDDWLIRRGVPLCADGSAVKLCGFGFPPVVVHGIWGESDTVRRNAEALDHAKSAGGGTKI
jgi:hypothetical protein